MDKGFMAINTTTGAGKAFLRSIYQLYASWGVDFGIQSTKLHSSFHACTITNYATRSFLVHFLH